MPAIVLSSKDAYDAHVPLVDHRAGDTALPIVGDPLMTSVTRSRELLGWTAGDPARRVAEWVHRHVYHSPAAAVWSAHDDEIDDAALDGTRESTQVQS